MSPRVAVWLIVLLVLFSVWANLPQLPSNAFGSFFQGASETLTGHFPLRFGLDLQGGTEMVLQTKMENLDPSDRDNALESARQVIERRVNLFGVSESVVRTSKVGEDRRILVELPGVDASTAAELVGKTAQLDFRELPASQSAVATISAQAVYEAVVPTGLTGADLKKAEVSFASSAQNAGSPQVAIQFTSPGATKFADVTKRNVGKPLAIFLDGKPLNPEEFPPTVQTEIYDGNAVITGRFTAEQAKKLATQLNAGALPVSITPLSFETIPPSLGSQSIHKSLLAGVIGIVTVMIFMVAYYGFYGVIADLALIIYTLITLAVMRTGLFIIPPVTLTLAGIAGFVLSVGMAVDANILIFERMKEESRMGKHGRVVLSLGFSRAWSSIRDSNISSLITAGILFTFGTSVVRGFALTLAIGVLVSMFSAITVTRTFLKLLPRFK